MTNPKSNSLLLTVQAALFAAFAVVFTLLVRIPIGLNGGYVHIGDAVIYLAAATLPLPYAMAAGAIAGGLSDVLAGVPMWALASVPIKAMLCLCFSSRAPKLLTLRNGLATAGAAVITCGGYYVAEWLIFGTGWAPLISVLENAGQALASAILFLILAPVLDRLKWKERLKGLS